jgi:CRISPR-associated protein Cas2
MLHVVCYDISSDPVRTRMSKALLDFGSRIQESVFECVLNAELYAQMLARLQRLPLGPDDRVRVYRVCERCVEQVEIYGVGEITRDPDFYVV